MAYFICTNVLFSQYIMYDRDDPALQELFNGTIIVTFIGNGYFLFITLFQISENLKLLF